MQGAHGSPIAKETDMRLHFPRFLQALPVLLASSLALLTSAAAQADQLDSILAAKKLRVAIDLAVPPYGMRDSQQQATGSDMETAQLLARSLGLALEIVPTNGASRITLLQDNKADVVISSLSITPERERIIDFSRPYAGILSVVGAPKSLVIKKAADLEGQTIATARGTTNDQEVSKIAPKNATVLRFDDDAGSLTAVVNGQAQVFATAPSLLKAVNDANPSRQMEVKLVMKVNPLAVGMRKGETRLKAKVDAWIGTQLQNGQLNTIYKKFHGTDLPELILHAGG
jgi:polar amino acid transport system substrate-binding protein